MRITNRHNGLLQKTRIPTGGGSALILYYPAGHADEPWLKDMVFNLLQGREGTPVKSSRFTTVFQFRNPKSGELFYCKVFHDRSIKDTIRNIFGFNRSRREFRADNVLLQKGFLTPLPIMFGAEYTGLFMKKNFLITKAVSGERTYQYFQSHFQVPLSIERVAEKRDLICAAGREIGRLHRQGICHGDLRVGNIIIDGAGSSARFFFIDNERSMHYSEIPEKKRLRNLVQLNMVRLPQITKTDRVRFFDAYLAENAVLALRRKEILRKIATMVQKRYEGKSG